MKPQKEEILYAEDIEKEMGCCRQTALQILHQCGRQWHHGKKGSPWFVTRSVFEDWKKNRPPRRRQPPRPVEDNYADEFYSI